MKKLFVIATIMMLCGFTASAQEQFIVDANAQLRTLKGSFTKIKVSHTIKAIITQANEESIAVSANDEKFIDEIITELEGNTLVIRSKNTSWVSKRNKQLKVYISFKKLEALELSGASDVITIGTINQPSLKIELSGASTLKTDVNANTLSIELNGASRLNLKGAAETFKADCSGASDVNAFDFTAGLANLDVSGASDIEISVSKEIKAEASGASSIRYKGNASITNVKTSGASSINKKG